MQKHLRRLGWGFYFLVLWIAIVAMVVAIVGSFTSPGNQVLAIVALAAVAYGLGYLILGESA